MNETINADTAKRIRRGIAFQSTANEKIGDRKKQSNARTESMTASKPGPKPPAQALIKITQMNSEVNGVECQERSSIFERMSAAPTKTIGSTHRTAVADQNREGEPPLFKP